MPLTLHLSKCWCWSADLGFAFLGHIASSCIHMHNDQISYSNDIEFLIYQTSGHLADLGFDYLLVSLPYRIQHFSKFVVFVSLPISVYVPVSVSVQLRIEDIISSSKVASDNQVGCLVFTIHSKGF